GRHPPEICAALLARVTAEAPQRAGLRRPRCGLPAVSRRARSRESVVARLAQIPRAFRALRNAWRRRARSRRGRSRSGQLRRFWHVRGMSGKGAISEMPIVRFLLIEGIGLDVIQVSKPGPRIMRYELTDFEWTAIRSLLPNKPRGIPRVDDRRVLNGIFWVLRSGAPWRDLPESYGPRTTCYNRFVRWRQADVWDRIVDALAAGHDAAIRMIDTSVVRVHQHGACIADNNTQD